MFKYQIIMPFYCAKISIHIRLTTDPWKSYPKKSAEVHL